MTFLPFNGLPRKDYDEAYALWGAHTGYAPAFP